MAARDTVVSGKKRNRLEWQELNRGLPGNSAGSHEKQERGVVVGRMAGCAVGGKNRGNLVNTMV
jgi:hypothetical protein